MSERRRAVFNGVISIVGGNDPGEIFAEPERWTSDAERSTGLEFWGDEQFQQGLGALLGALADLDGLSPLGVVTYSNMIRQALVNRLRFLDAAAPRKELVSPVIITGLPRSGTTALHRFLALDPGFHAPPLWELLDPFSKSSATLRRWRTRVQIGIKNRLLPDLDAKHYTRADTAEECTLLVANSLASPLFWDLAPLDGYLEWVQATDQRPVYADYRRQLEILQALHPNRRLLLKAPAHLGNLAELRDAVPEASLIQTHRDPTACFFSHCSLRTTLAEFVLDAPDRRMVAAHVARVFDHDLAANLTFHERAPGQIVNVSQTELRMAPVKVIHSIYGRCDLEWTPEIEGATERFSRANPRGRHGKHHPPEGGWGVSRAEIDGRFADYRRRFAAELEG